MAETRSQASLRESIARETETAAASRFEAIEQAMVLQNGRAAQMGDNVREMMETMKALMNRNPWNASTSGTAHEREEPQGIENEVTRVHQQGYRRKYNGMTRLTKIEFPRFDGSKMKEWFPKAEQFFLFMKHQKIPKSVLLLCILMVTQRHGIKH